MAFQTARWAVGRLIAPGQLARSLFHPHFYNVCFLLKEKRIYPRSASLLPAPPSRAATPRPQNRGHCLLNLCLPLQVQPRRRDLAGSPAHGALCTVAAAQVRDRCLASSAASSRLQIFCWPAASFWLLGPWLRAVVLLCGAGSPRHAGL